jgi:hypothetical protein
MDFGWFFGSQASFSGWEMREIKEILRYTEIQTKTYHHVSSNLVSRFF